MTPRAAWALAPAGPVCGSDRNPRVEDPSARRPEGRGINPPTSTPLTRAFFAAMLTNRWLSHEGLSEFLVLSGGGSSGLFA